MAVFNEPSKWQTSLVNSGDANTIPQNTPAGTGEASFEDGFPQITQVPIGAGGIAPDRKDFNGLFKILGDWIFFAQNGGLPTYSANFDYVVGRYVVFNNTLYKCIQANGASSTVVTPDSVDPDYLGSDYWVQVATLADFANFANTDLSNLSASGQALFTNKADKDFSNVNAPVQAFKDQSIEWGQPDYDSEIDITTYFTTAGGSYTAPKNGYIYAITNGESNSFIYKVAGEAYGSINNTFIFMNGYTQNGNVAQALMPINEGQTIYQNVNYGLLSARAKVYFIPCKGV